MEITLPKKSIILWLNSSFASSAFVINNKYYELTYDIPQITLFKTSKLKVVSFISQKTTADIKVIRLKNLLIDGLSSFPLNYPILYVSNTGVESQLENNQITLSLLPQTINSITLFLDDQFNTNFAGINADIIQITDVSVYYDIIRNGVILNPLVWYRFDVSTNLGLDAMNNYNLTNNNGVGYNSTNFIKGTGSGSFNGTNQTLSNINAFNMNNKDFTISFWSYKTNTTNTQNKYFFQIGNTFSSGFNYIIACYRAISNDIVFYFASEFLTYTTTTSYLNTWIHLALTYNNTTRQCAIYLNGALVASKTNIRTINVDTSFIIGAVPGNVLAFEGLMDDFRIYDTILTQTEISNLYNGLINYYQPPKFILGLVIEDSPLEVVNTVSPYK